MAIARAVIRNVGKSICFTNKNVFHWKYEQKVRNILYSDATHIQPCGHADSLDECDFKVERCIPNAIIMRPTHITVFENEQRHRYLIAMLAMIGVQFEAEFGGAQISQRHIFFRTIFIWIELAAIGLIACGENVHDKKPSDQLPIISVVRILWNESSTNMR